MVFSRHFLSEKLRTVKVALASLETGVMSIAEGRTATSDSNN